MRYLTADEVARELRRSPRWVVRTLIRAGLLPGFRVGASWRVRDVDLAAWVEERIRAEREPVLVPVPPRRRRMG